MTAAWGTVGTVPTTTGTGTGTTSVTPGAPGSLADGDYAVIAVQNKPSTSTPDTPSGWTLINTVAGGQGASGTSTGASRVTLFGRVKDASWSAMPTITIPSGSSALAICFRLTKTLGFWESPASTTGADSTDGTGFSVTMAANPGITAGDFVFVFAGVGDDGAAWSAETITATGLTVGTVTERAEPKTSQGGDVGGALWTASPTSGTASAAPVVGATLSTSQSGPAILVRIRDTNTPPAQTVNPTAIASGETWGSGGGSSTKNILVVHDDPTPSADDTNLINFLTGKGHTVTTQSEVNALPDTGYDCIIITESGSSGSTAIVDIPGCLLPVMIFETTSNTALITTSAMVTGGTAGTTWDLQTHALTAGYPDPLTVFTSSQSMYGVPQADLASGATALAVAPGSTHVTCAIVESGANLTSGTAPNRRSYMGLVSTRLTGIVAGTDSGNFFNDVVVWLGGGAGGGGGPTVSQGATTVSPTAISSAQAFGTPVISGAGTTVVTPTGIASQETFPGGGGQSNPNLPVLMGTTHVEPESSGYCPPVIDSNGNLYRITESQLAANNQPRAMKSTNGGETWTEMDAANRPGTDTGSIGDLESGWVTYDSVRKAITFTWQRSYVAYSQFRTSDHPTNPDTWVSNTRENMQSSTGSPQYASHTSPTNQTYEWVFFNNSTTKPSYKSRTSSGSYGSTLDVDSAGQHPAAILDSNNVSHIIYIKSSQLHYKSLSSGGTLSGTSTRMDSGGVNTTAPIAHAAPQAYVSGGNTYVGALFANGSGIAKFVLMTNGTAGSEETVSASAVVLDPGATVNQSAILSLAVDPTNGTFHAIWSQASNGDVMYASRPLAGSWSTPVSIQNPAFTPAWVFCRVNTYPSGLRVLSYNYSEEVTDDQTNIYYGESVLGGGGSGGATITQSAPACRPDPIGTGESFGVPVVQTIITSSPGGISSVEAFGTPVRTSTITAAPGAITTLESFGTASAIGGPTSVSPTGLATSETFGSVTISAGGTILQPTSVSSAQAFGTVTITAGATSVSPTGITSLQAFGTLSVTRDVTVSPTGIVTAETMGTVTIGLGTLTVSPSGIVTALAFGTVTITIGGVTMIPNSILTAEAFGTPTVTITGVLITLFPESITTEQAFGTPNAQFTGLAPVFIGWGVRIF